MTFATARLAASKAPLTAFCTTTSPTAFCLAPIARSLGPHTHQRRPSSSKSSSPANGPKRVAPAHELPANTAEPAKTKEGEEKVARKGAGKTALARKARNAVESLAAISDALQGKEVVKTPAVHAVAQPEVQDLPWVQSNGSSLQDVQTSAFFAMHRPIAPAAAFPGTVTDDQFASLFKPAPTPSDTAQSVSDLVSHFQRLRVAQQTSQELAGAHDGHLPLQQWPGAGESDAFRALLTGRTTQLPTVATTQHLDGDPAQDQHLQPLSLRAQPPKQGAGSMKLRFAHEPSPVTKVRLYTSDVTLVKYLHENGAVTSAYDASPLVEQPRFLLPSAPSERAYLTYRPNPDHDQAAVSTRLHRPHAWSLHRRAMWQRQEATTLRAAESGWVRLTASLPSGRLASTTMSPLYETLSVKRIRKAKMKKKKYRKLLRRTRNLRTKLEKGG